MPYLQLPNKKYIAVAPGLSYEQALSLAKQRFPLLYDTRGIFERAGSATVEGIKQLGESASGVGAGTRSLFGDTAGTQRYIDEQAKERAEGAKQPRGIEFQNLIDQYKTEGILPALSNVPAYVTEQILKNAPSMAVPLAAGAATTAYSAPLLGPFAPAAGLAMGIGAYGLQTFGQNIQRQAGTEGRTAETMEPGQALGAAAIGAPLGFLVDRFVLGLGKMPTKTTIALFEKEIGARSVGKTLAVGAAKGLTEVPTEMLEQVLERAQAGLDLTNAEAKAEYLEAAGGALAIGPVGGAGFAYRARGQAKEAVEQREELEKAQERNQARMAAAQKQVAQLAQTAKEERIGSLNALPEGAQLDMFVEQRRQDIINSDITAKEKAQAIQKLFAEKKEVDQVEEPDSRENLLGQQALLTQFKASLSEQAKSAYDTNDLRLIEKLRVQYEQTTAVLNEIEKKLTEIPVLPTRSTLDKKLVALEKQRAVAKESGDIVKGEALTKKIVELQKAIAETPEAESLFTGVPSLKEGRLEREFAKEGAALREGVSEESDVSEDRLIREQAMGRGIGAVTTVDANQTYAGLMRNADAASKRVDAYLFDFTDSLDSLRKGEVLGTDTTEEKTLVNNMRDEAKENVNLLVDSILTEAAHIRAATGKPAITKSEIAGLSSRLRKPFTRLLDRAYVTGQIATGKEATARSAQTNNAMYAAFERAKLTPMGPPAPQLEGVIKRGLSREEYAKLTRLVATVRKRLANPIARPTIEVTKPFALVAQTEEDIQAKEAREQASPSVEATRTKLRALLNNPNLSDAAQKAIGKALDKLNQTQKEKVEKPFEQPGLWAGTLASEERKKETLETEIKKRKEKHKKISGKEKALLKISENIRGLKKTLADAGLPGLRLEVGRTPEGLEQMKASVETTAEIMKLQVAIADAALKAKKQLGYTKNELEDQFTQISATANQQLAQEGLSPEEVAEILATAAIAQQTLSRGLPYFRGALKRRENERTRVKNMTLNLVNLQNKFANIAEVIKNVSQQERDNQATALANVASSKEKDFAKIVKASEQTRKNTQLKSQQRMQEIRERSFARPTKEVSKERIHELSVAAALEGTERRTREPGRVSIDDLYTPNGMWHVWAGNRTQALEDTIINMKKEQKKYLGARSLKDKATFNRIEKQIRFFSGQLNALKTLQRRGLGKQWRRRDTKPGRQTLPANKGLPGNFAEKKAVLKAFQQTKVLPKGVREEARVEAKRLATVRLQNEGVNPKTQKGTARHNQYALEYFNNLITARLTAENIKRTKELLRAEETELSRINYDPRGVNTKDSGVNTDDAAAVATRVKNALPKGINFTYAATTADLPAGVREAMAAQGHQTIKGAVLPDGRVFVVGEAHKNIADLQDTIAHELIGHYGVDTILGKDGVQALTDKLFAKGNDYVAQVATGLGVFEDVSSAMSALETSALTEDNINVLRTSIVREMIAHAAEGRRVAPNFVEKVKGFLKDIIAAVRGWFRNTGLSEAAKQDTKAIQALIKDAERALAGSRLGAYVSPTGEAAFRTKMPAGFEAIQDFADAVIAKPKGLLGTIKSRSIKQNRLAATVSFVDRFAAIEEVADDAIKAGNGNEAMQMMYFLQKQLDMLSMASASAYNGALVLVEEKGEFRIQANNGASLRTTDQALKPLLKMGFNAAQVETLFTSYLASLRGAQEGYEKLNFDPEVIKMAKEIVSLLKTKPEVKAVLDNARDEYNEYNKGQVRFLEKTGTITPELAAGLLKKNDYIPYYRDVGGVLSMFIGSGTTLKLGDLKNQPHLQKLVGGDDKILSYFESSMQNTLLLTDLSLRNLATKNTAHAFRTFGLLESHKGRDGKDYFIRSGNGPANANVLRFKDNGVEKHVVVKTEDTPYEYIPTELLVRGMEGTALVMPTAVKLFSLPAQVVRKGITLNPVYPYYQLVKDSMAMGATRGVSFSNAINLLKGINQYINGDALIKELQAKGVISEREMFTGTIDDVAKIRNRVLTGEGKWSKFVVAQEARNVRADGAVRAMLYSEYLKKGLSARDAEYMAIKAMPYNRRGLDSSMRYLSQMVPFFNAQIVGLYSLYQSIRGQGPMAGKLQVKKKLYTAGMGMAVSTLIYAALVAGEDWYENMPLETRLRNWLIKLPGMEEPVAIPIPFEFGIIFKAFFEATYMGMFNSSPEGKKILEAFASVALGAIPLPTPALIKPAVELWANKVSFTGNPIEGARELGVEAAERFRDTTSEFAKSLGRSTGLVGVSPLQIDHLIRGYTGTVGPAVIALLDVFTGPANPATGVKPDTPISKLPLLSQIFKSADGGALIDLATDTLRKAEQISKTHKKIIDDGRYKEAAEYLEKNQADIMRGNLAGKLRQRLGEYAKVERAIKARPASEMSSSEKRKALEYLRQSKIQESKNYMQAFRIGA